MRLGEGVLDRTMSLLPLGPVLSGPLLECSGLWEIREIQLQRGSVSGLRGIAVVTPYLGPRCREPGEKSYLDDTATQKDRQEAKMIVMKRPPAGTIPDRPGSYQFKDIDGRVIYVGKAKSLRQRLSNYFGNPALLHPRTAQMVMTAESVEWIEVRNDVEALMLEYSLIKRFKPRFNVRLIDDKSYPFLALTMGDEYPRAVCHAWSKTKRHQIFRSICARVRHT